MSDIAETYEEYKSGKYEMVKGMSRLGCYQGLDYLEEINEKLDEAKKPNFKIDIERFEDNLVFMKSHIKSIEKENKQLKEVIKEVREYINNNTEFEHDGDDYGYTEWVNIKPQNIVFINELLQILDKAKKVNR